MARAYAITDCGHNCAKLKENDILKVLQGLKSCFSLMGRYKYMYWTTLILEIILSFGADVLMALVNKGVINSVTSLNFAAFKVSILLGFGAIALYLISVLDRFFNMRSIRYIMYDMRNALFRHMEFLPVDYYDNNHSGDSIFRLNSNVENMKRAYTSHCPNFLRGILGGAASCIFILVMDFRIGVLALVICALTVFVNVRYAASLREIGGKIQRSESALVSRLSDLIAGFRVIKLFDSAHRSLGRYEEANSRTASLRINRIARIGGLDSVSHFLNFLNNFVLITIGAVMGAKGMTDFGTVFAILTVQSNVSGMVLNFGSSWGMMQESVAAADLIHEVWDTKQEQRSRSEAGEEAENTEYIEFRDVGFSYSDGSKVLSGLSFKVKKGSTAALVGPSGGGKSTVIKLLQEFYRIDSGSIYVDGRNIYSIPVKELRDMIAYVPQDAYLFDASVKENISYGKPGASDSEIIEAAKAANAHEFITELSDGYDTIVGERGETLSGGQRQRIAIARAFLKNAPILLLDEATSALDNENEVIVQSSIEALMQNRTVIVIAHRLSTIENADVIYVIQDGKVVQSGVHEDLKNESGTYAELVRLSKA
ncbi:MAG: ABC transporter ATP-binding protein/permease [Clostridiales bacterium]|nr:ABC transporter ATP-binding protein/permease [Clostridiales bacterium]